MHPAALARALALALACLCLHTLHCRWCTCRTWLCIAHATMHHFWSTCSKPGQHWSIQSDFSSQCKYHHIHHHSSCREVFHWHISSTWPYTASATKHSGQSTLTIRCQHSCIHPQSSHLCNPDRSHLDSQQVWDSVLVPSWG